MSLLAATISYWSSIYSKSIQASKLPLCAQSKQVGDARVLPATWLVSHAWQMKFSDLVKALELFFAVKSGAVFWLDLFSASQHSMFDKPPEWWQQTFCFLWTLCSEPVNFTQF